ncbi:MAG: aminodeoxychorismate synthase component I [Acidimicrobiia bacterium]|nr:aminodeoxychorismate synthase component I [Acidimicrobiia bacterium]MDX2468121.1 aminodeoxychorismate synthase component I [Acidimicrobiia bacterium]
MAITARLDDLRPNRLRSAAFSNQVGEVSTTRVEGVVPVLAQAEAAAASGLWVVGYIGYEAAPAFDPDLAVRPRNQFHDAFPLVWFGLYKDRHLNLGFAEPLGDYQLTPWKWVDSQPHFEQDIATIRDHIVAGDTYQVNYTSRLRSHFSGDPMAFYRDLAEAQSGGYGTFLDTGRFWIVSASPELFFDRYPVGEGTDRLITRPMKGTVSRGRWASEDAMRKRQLEESAKDRAENLIVVDLLRNDLGRVAHVGSVCVDELMAVERYDTVWQMTSTISAEISSDMTLTSVLRGLFPCGSITGAPKIRTMEIIRDLESEPRGVYTGAIGFLSPPHAPGPRASFSVGIRTVVIDSRTGEAEYGIGGGITFDSDPTAEYEEAALKARILTYGTSDFELLETVRWSPTAGWYWLDRHVERLVESAAYFGIPVDRSEVVRRLDDAVAGGAESRVRLTVSRQGLIGITVAPFVLDERVSVAISIDREPVDVSSPFLFHKTTRRDVYEARRARHPNAEDVLLVNDRGELTESTIANVAVQIDGVWVTPPIDAGCLPGVYRQVLLDEGRIEERTIAVADLERCEGIALLNSVRLWRPAFVVGD